MSTQANRILVQELQVRYGIKRSAVSSRLKRLKVKPVKDGRHTYISPEQLELLDALNTHIKNGGTSNDFIGAQSSAGGISLGSSSQEDFAEASLEHSSGISWQNSVPLVQLDKQAAAIALFQALMQRSDSLVNSSAPVPDRFAYFRILEDAAAKGWELTTSEVGELLSLSSRTVTSYGQRFEQAGFRFARLESKRRGEVCWTVSKPKKGKRH